MRLGIFIAPFFLFVTSSIAQQDWRTDYEKSGFTRSPRYSETHEYLKRLDRASPWVQLTSFGKTPQGRDLPLVILSKDRAFTPAKARSSGKPVVLIQSGIHAGEIDGKDASLMLIREIAITKSLSYLADNAIVLFMPIFNLDGHERQSKFNRINQNGPEEMGWRTTAQNYNLNRDYLKADAPEMRAWLSVFNEWLPELLIDCHVTNGIDFQYNLTYAMEMYGNAAPSVVSWQKELVQSFTAGMASQNDPVFPYVFPREDSDLSKGLLSYAAPPRFSTGYAAVRNRAALLVETHMLKSYRDRVTATYRLLVEVLSFIGKNPLALVEAVKQADAETVRFFSSSNPAQYPIQFQGSDKATMREFLGYEAITKRSVVTGREYHARDRTKPESVSIPFFDDVKPSLSITPPRMYFIPQEWNRVIEVLQAHGIRVETLAEPHEVEVETYVFSQAKWRSAPFENHHTLESVKHTTRIESITYPAGTYVVRLNQTAAKVAIHLLEPDAPDSFVSWGFFDSIFEQKEYFEGYVMEEIAAQMMASDLKLKAEYEARIAEDSVFAANARARLSFFYQRSPYYDQKMNVYPVGRLMKDVSIETRKKTRKGSTNQYAH